MSDARFGAPMPLSYREQIEKVPGVTTVAALSTPFSALSAELEERDWRWRGPTRSSSPRGPEITATKEQIGHSAAHRTGAITTVAIASKYGWKTGDRNSPLQSPVTRKDGAKTLGVRPGRHCRRRRPSRHRPVFRRQL